MIKEAHKTGPAHNGKDVCRSQDGSSISGEPAVDVIDLTVLRDRLPILGDITFSLPQGQTLALLGSNGAGKSTLLKCLAGLVRADCGRIRWFGEIDSRTPAVRHRIGYVGHEFGLYRELTAAENLTFAGRMHGVANAPDRALQLLQEADLAWASHSEVAKLSQGMCRRLAILRALVHEPMLILLDEPFASLDRESTHWLEQRFEYWRTDGRTVCFASHDVVQSRVIADRTVVLESGQIAADEFGPFPVEFSLRSAS